MNTPHGLRLSVYSLILLAAVRAPAQTPPQSPPAAPPAALPQQPPRNPASTTENDRLRFLLGFWEEEVDFAGPDSGSGRGRWFARPVLGLHIALDYSSGGPQGPYRANAVLAWDKNEKTYRMWWLDDAGAIGEYRGTFRDENTLVLEHHGTTDNRDFRERITYKRVSPTEVHTRIEQAWDKGDWKPYLDAVAYRRGDNPPRPLNPPPQPQPPQPSPVRPPG
jgi:hypothetical protein